MDTEAVKAGISLGFLQGGGEMGELTRNFDWAGSSLGTPEQWPQSLRTTLGIILHSAFPMFLFWGDDRICFYNDAYRPSLGIDGKHPALGKKAEDVWPEIWEFVLPLITKVGETGEPVWFEDQYLPIFRNGRMEDVYWTFSYSPVYGDAGAVEGIFITCVETTGQVKTISKLQESDKRFQHLVREATVGIVVLTGEEMKVEIVNDAYGKLINLTREDLLGKNLFEVIPHAEAVFRPLLSNVLHTGEPVYLYDQPYLVYTNGIKIEGYLNVVYQPYREDDGTIKGVMALCHDVTQQVRATQKVASSEQRMRSLINSAPVAIGLFLGRDLVVDMHNQTFVDIVGKGPDITGKPLREVMPELLTENQPFLQILDDVYTTGKTFQSHDSQVSIVRDGVLSHNYYNITYSPVYDENGEVYGILDIAVDVTGEVMARKALALSEQNLRNTILKAPVAMCILREPAHIVEIANEKMFELWGKTSEEMLNKPIFEGLPEARGQGFEEMLDGVYNTGVAFVANGVPITLPRNGGIELVYVNFVYEAFREGDVIKGVIAVATEVTSDILYRKQLEESEQQIRSVIEAAPFPIGVYIGEEYRILFANQTMKDIWGKGNEVTGKMYRDLLPEFENQYVFRQLDEVYKTGVPFNVRNKELEIIEDGVKKYYYINHNLTPLKDTEGKTYGIISTAADVTDLIVAKHQVEKSEQNLRNMILQAPVAMCMLMGNEHVIEVANDLMIELWGKPKDDMMGRPLWEALPDAKEQGLEEVMANVYYKGETFKASEMPVELYRNGTFEDVYQNFVYEPYRGADGTILGVLVVTIDVTAQVAARKKIEQSEERVRAIIKATPFPIGVYAGEEMRIEFANQSIIDVWGKGNDVVGKRYTEILPELQNQQIFEQIRNVYITGKPFHARNQRVDLMIEDKMQSFWFNYSFTPVYDAGGKIYGVMNTAAEVTDLNLAKQKVEASEKSLRNIILQAPVAMCIYRGKEFVIEIANQKMLELWGKSADAIGKPHFVAIPESGGQGYEELLADVLTTGKPFSATEQTVMLQRAEGIEKVYTNFAFEPILGLNGHISGIFATATDVTAQVQARQKIEEVVAERTAELATANHHLQRSNAELEQFAYIASHDLQEPLRKVSTYTQMLEHSLGSVPERSKSYLDKINSSTTRMTGLIRDVLAYSQLSTETRELKPVNLAEVVEGIKQDYELLIEQKQAQIIFGEMPVIEAIPLQMSQLFSNIVSNALKFSVADVPPVININASHLSNDEAKAYSLPTSGHRYHKIEIKDNGIGFSQEYAEQIFNIFQRLHGKMEYSGTGIGLAMCKKIAQNHHGEIFATSKKGEGAMFTIILPEKQ